MHIPEERVGLHFANMMLSMAWAHAADADDVGFFQRFDRAQSNAWRKLSTEEKNFQNKVTRAAQRGDRDPPICERCGEECTMETGHEPTRYCDPCAHIRVEELLRVIETALSYCETKAANTGDIHNLRLQLKQALGGT